MCGRRGVPGRAEAATLSPAPLPSVGRRTQTSSGLNWQMDSRGIISLTCTVGGSAGLNDQLGLLNVFTKK